MNGHGTWTCPIDEEKPWKDVKHDSDIISLFVRKSMQARSKKVKKETNFNVQLCAKKIQPRRIYLD